MPALVSEEAVHAKKVGTVWRESDREIFRNKDTEEWMMRMKHGPTGAEVVAAEERPRKEAWKRLLGELVEKVEAQEVPPAPAGEVEDGGEDPAEEG